MIRNQNLPPASASSFKVLAILIHLIFLLAAFGRQIKLFNQLLWLLCGWLLWTLWEYCYHRFLAHGKQKHAGKGVSALHIHHHQHPTEIAIRVWQRVLFLSTAIALLWLSFNLNGVFMFITGFYLGFTGYCFMHWFLHQRISGKIFPELHRFHIFHHCKYPDKCFGISVPWWDHLFGSYPKENPKISERVIEFYHKKNKAKPFVAASLHKE